MEHRKTTINLLVQHMINFFRESTISWLLEVLDRMKFPQRWLQDICGYI